MGHTQNIDLNKEVPASDLKLDTTPEQRAAYKEAYDNLPPRTETPVTDAVREMLKDPEKAKAFAEGGNAFAAGLRVASEIQTQESKFITYDDFTKVKIVAGNVLSAERVVKSDKLLNLSVDLGGPAPRQIIAGIGKTFQPESLVGKQFAFVANLAPRIFKVGKLTLESHGMILATGEADKLSLVNLTGAVSNGSQLG